MDFSPINALLQPILSDELVTAREHPAMAGGIGIAAGLLLMRGIRCTYFILNFLTHNLRTTD